MAEELPRRAGGPNLIAPCDPAEIVDRHLLDSARFLAPLREAHAHRVIDVGSGGGLPGLVVAILAAEIEVTLLDSKRRKTERVEAIRQCLAIPNAHILTERAEVLAHATDRRESHDAALARALADLAVCAELLLPFVRVGGLALVAKGPDPAEEIERARRAVETLGGTIGPPQPYRNPGREERFHLVTLSKHAPTPATYPRRPGLPRRRPL